MTGITGYRRSRGSLLRWMCLGWLILVSNAHADELTIFAAASLQNALDEAKAVYEASHPHRVTVSYAASSALAKQIEQDAPADLFISADQQWMDYLLQRKRILPGSRHDLLGNRLVMIAPRNSAQALEIKPGFELAAVLGDEYLAVGDPDHVPAGRYAKAALEWMGVWDRVVTNLARAENVRAALNFVALRECPLGIVYESDAHDEARVTVVGIFPPEAHPAIVYPMVLTLQGQDAAAQSLHAFLKSAPAQAIFLRHGFSAAAQATSTH